MEWLTIGIQLLLPALIAIYTVNYGRWMASNKNRTGAFGAYGIAVAAMAVTVWAVLIHNR